MRWLWLVSAIAAWSAFVVWSVRTFWRTPDDAPQAKIFAVTKSWATIVTVATALLFPLELPIPEGPYVLRAICWALWVFPLSLWGGYFFSRIVFAIIDPDR